MPALLDAAIRAAHPERFPSVIDLGCGTGLMGEKLRPLCAHLEGYDISAGMLRIAREKAVYDRLVKADLQTLVHEGEPVDLVTAADVFMYVGGLENVTATAGSMLREGGVFAFSVEHWQGKGDLILQPSRRYAHSETYVRSVLTKNALIPLSLETHMIRQDRGQPIEGLIVVARKDATTR